MNRHERRVAKAMTDYHESDRARLIEQVVATAEAAVQEQDMSVEEANSVIARAVLAVVPDATAAEIKLANVEANIDGLCGVLDRLSETHREMCEFVQQQPGLWREWLKVKAAQGDAFAQRSLAWLDQHEKEERAEATKLH